MNYGKNDEKPKIASFELYQYEALKTQQVFPDPKQKLTNAALGLAGEMGEIIEPIKKFLTGTLPTLEPDKMREEIGGVLWYMASLCDCLGITLREVAEYNIWQLRKRHGDKFSGYGNRDWEGK